MGCVRGGRLWAVCERRETMSCVREEGGYGYCVRRGSS